MVLLENEQFLTELTKFYQRAKTSGTVLTSMKRYDGRTKPHPRKNAKKTTTSSKSLGGNQSSPSEPQPADYKCLIRASMGSKKIRTIIQSRDINKFQLAYSNLIRGNIELKKKEKKVETSKKSGGGGSGNATSSSNAAKSGGHSKATQ